MGSIEERLSRISLALLPLGIITFACAIGLLPQDLVIRTGKVLAVWVSLSLPIGVFIGHCMPREMDRA